MAVIARGAQDPVLVEQPPVDDLELREPGAERGTAPTSNDGKSSPISASVASRRLLVAPSSSRSL